MKRCFIIILSTVTILGCNDSDHLPTPIIEEEEIIEQEIVEKDTLGYQKFSTLINNELFIPDRTGLASYYSHKLEFGAIDTVIHDSDEIRYQLYFSIINPVIGTNKISNTVDSSSIQLYQWQGRFGSAAHATSGEFTLTEFDTLAGTFSGTFNCIIDYPEHTIFYELQNGQFNDFTFVENFCEPEFEVKENISESLTVFWGLIGFRNSEGNILHPPCDTETYLRISKSESSESRYSFNGQAPINRFGFTSELLNNTFATEGIFTTRAGGSRIDMDYEHEFIDFLNYDEISYGFETDSLILSNSTSDSVLVFVPI